MAQTQAFSAGYPAVSSITAGGFTLAVKSNEAGEAHYVVVPDGTAAPTSAMVSAAAGGGTYTDADGATVTPAATASITVTAADTEYTDDITGLDGQTAYDVYVVLEDGDNALQSSPTKRELTTSDDVAPSFVTGYPLIVTDSVTASAFEVDVQSTETGTAYVLVTVDGQSTPSASEIQGASVTNVASGSVSITSAEVTFTVSFSGLDDITAYDVHVVLVDQASNDGSVESLDVTTLDATAPVVSSFELGTAAGTSVSFTVQNDEDSVVYAAIAPSTTAEPTSTQLKAQIPWVTPVPGDLNMRSETLVGGVSATYTFTGLQSETEYTVFIVSVDSHGNLQATPSTLSQNTTDITSPSWLSTTALGGAAVATPVATNITGTSYELLVSVSEPATIYYVANALSDAAPSAANIVADRGRYMCENFEVTDADSPVYFTVEGSVADPSSDSNCDSSDTSGDQCTDCPQVLPEQMHVIWLVAVDASGNYATSPQRVDLVTLDVTPPETLASSVGNVRGQQVDLTVRADEVSTAYVLAVPQGATAPTPEQVKAGVAYADVTVPTETGRFFSDSFLVYEPIAGATYDSVTAEWSAVEATFELSKLDEETPYTVYFVLEDRPNYITPEDALNLQESVNSIDVTTLDITPPSFDSAELQDMEGDQVTINVTMSEGGTAYAVAVPLSTLSRATTPTSAQVIAGADGAGTSQPSVSVSVNGDEATTADLTGLTSETTYAIFFVGEDDATPTANVGARPIRRDVTTTDVTAPTSVSSSVLSSGRSVDVLVSLDEPGTAYAVAIAGTQSSVTPPTSAQIKAGLDDSGSAAVAAAAWSVPESSVTYHGSLTGLDSETDYVVMLIYEDDAPSPGPNLAADGARELFEITTDDVTAPVFDSSTDVTTPGSNSVSFDVQTDEAGTAYAVVVKQGDGTPSAIQVKAGTGPSGAKVSGGPITISTPNVAESAVISALDAQTAYTLFLTVEDGADPPNLRTDVLGIDFTTTDNVPPVFAVGFPDIPAADVVGEGQSTSVVQVQLDAQLDEVGTVYYIAVPKGQGGSPSATQVKNFQTPTSTDAHICGTIDIVAGGAVYSDTQTHSIACEDPSEGTDVAGVGRCGDCPLVYPETFYDVYFVAEDDDGNLQAAPVKVEWYAVDSRPPDATTHTYSTVTPTSITLSVEFDEDCTVRYVATTDSTEPDLAQIQAGQDGTGSSATSSGSFAAAADTVTTHVVGGLAQATDWYVWTAAVDAAGNHLVRNVTATTEDNIVPVISAVDLTIDATTRTTINLEVTLDEPGDVHYVFIPANTNNPPSSAQVKAGVDADNVDPTTGDGANGTITVSTADTATDVDVTDLAEGVLYSVYLAAEDAAGNLQGTPSVYTQASGDGTAPTLPALTYGALPDPAGDDTKALLKVSLSEPGTVEYAFYSSSESPAASDVDGESSLLVSGSVAITEANQEKEVLVDVSTNSYYGYLSAFDDSVDQNYLAATEALPPTVLDADLVDSGTMDLTIKLSHDSSYAWYVVLERGATAPTPTQIKAGTDASDATPVAAGSVSVGVGESVGTESDVSGDLDEKGLYDIYVVASDQATPTSTQYTQVAALFERTAPDMSAPLFKAGFPATTDVRSGSLQLTVKTDEAAKVYYVVTAADDTAPTVSEVRSGQESGGGEPLAKGEVVVDNPNFLYKADIFGLADQPHTVVGGAEYAGSALKVHVVAYDFVEAVVTHAQAAVTSVPVTTLSDDTRLYSLECTLPSGAACELQCGKGRTYEGGAPSDPACSSGNSFEPGVRDYRIFAADDEETITLTSIVTVEDNAGGVAINGTAVSSNSVTKDLGYGLNYFVLTVTAEDPYVSGEYVVVVDREFGGAALNSTLESLLLSDAATDLAIDFRFDAALGAADYRVAIDSSVERLNVSTRAFYPDDVEVTLFWNGGQGYDVASTHVVLQLDQLQEVPSTLPTQMITIVATAGGVASTYGLTVQRYGPGACSPRGMCDDWFPYVPPEIRPESPLVELLDVQPTRDDTYPELLNLEVAYTTALVAPFTETLKVTDDSVTLAVQLSEQGKVYFVVLADGATPPPQREVIEAYVEGAVAMGSFTSEPYKLTQPGFEYTITGLSAGTNYDIYIVAEDYALDSALRPAPNAGPVTRVDATTLA